MEEGKWSTTTVHGKKEIWELLKKCSFMIAVKTMERCKPGYIVPRNELESEEKGHSVIDR